MKRLFLIPIALLVISTTQAQILKNAANRLKQKVEQKTNEKIDQAVDNAVDGKKNTDGASANPEATTASYSESSAPVGSQGTQTIKSYSKYDFIPGDKIIYTDDFAKDVLGEFPVNWNTNGGGEVTTIEGLSGKWLKIEKNTNYESPFKTKLPDNYTVEYDLLLDYDSKYTMPSIKTLLLADVKPGHSYGGQIELLFMPNNGPNTTPDGVYYSSLNADGNGHITGRNLYLKAFNDANHKKMPVHVAIWVQKERIRTWVNEQKIYDLPKGIAPDVQINHLKFETGSGPDEYKYFISNIKIASAAPDTRNKLITEGKWSTSGILFDVASDKIKPASYGVLKEIAGVLAENGAVKVKIIGHTDNDGDDAANLDLSKRRAAAVKTALSSEFGIDASRMQTDGMGESKPVADNSKPEGKAQNRRVEFVKL